MNRYSALFVAGLLLAGSAGAVDRDDAQMELSQAINAVQAADRDDAAQYAPSELEEAHAMLQSAQLSRDRHSWTGVALYAERAKVAGDLASARSRQHRAESATTEIERSVAALRAQLSASGVAQ
jgi:hypothetical protein